MVSLQKREKALSQFCCLSSVLYADVTSFLQAFFLHACEGINSLLIYMVKLSLFAYVYMDVSFLSPSTLMCVLSLSL